MRCLPPPSHASSANGGTTSWQSQNTQAGPRSQIPRSWRWHGRTERRAIVTNNLRDYRPLHAEAITPGGPGHFGMVCMPGSYRRTKADTGRIISALKA
jgi:hypothetical protein